MAYASSPCAACKLLRRRCKQECVYAPHFPQELPRKFAAVHKVYGSSNVGKLLNELPCHQREDAVNSLIYEAEARLRDPVYGCVGLISILQYRYKLLQIDLENARKELAAYVGPQAMLPIYQPIPQPQYLTLPPLPQTQPQSQLPSSSLASVLTHHHQNTLPIGELYHQQQQQIFEAQELGVVAGEQQNEMFRAYEGGSNSPLQQQNQSQVEIMRFDNGYDSVPNGSVTITGLNQLSPGGIDITGMSLGGSNFVENPSSPTNNNYHTAQQLHIQEQLFIPTPSSQPLQLQTQETTQTQTQTQTQTNSESEDGNENDIGLFRKEY